MHNCLKYGAIPVWEMYITLFERVSSLQSRLFLEVLQQSLEKYMLFSSGLIQLGNVISCKKYTLI
jgi:hypothetical protein